ncbi:transporter substrate-binding domain-containing diguanylate cyclase [Beduini massiliensis]|uniref:transporter substrate-binding domain-containing diguanylate cyclase n=1 Tax=Beduini massiliensis TaxID=1585974 RepID=UPI00059A9993|nr:transporter substrate-binding domain-containing protein [Beduini massiliensis]
MHKRNKRIIMLFFIVLSLMLSGIPLHAKEKRIIRVGYPIQAGLTEVDEEENYSGYTYEYLQEIAQYANWEYEFVRIDKDINDSLIELMGMLERGEIDLLGGMVYSETLAEKYDYVGHSYGNANTVLKVLYNSDITNLNSASRTELKVAVIKGSTQRQSELKEFCALYKITPVLIECETDIDQRQALSDGRADALLDVSANPTNDLRTIATFSPRPFYFATTKGKSDIVSEMNSAIDLIEQTDPYYTSNLYDKYFGGNSSILKLTTEELDFIEANNTIRVGILTNNPPFQYMNSKGQLDGITIDLLDYISEKTNLHFDLVLAASQDELNQLIADNKVDITSYAVCDYSSNRDSDVALTRPYLKTQNFIALKNGSEQNDLKNMRYISYLNEPLSNYDKSSLTVNNLKDALDAIQSRKADFTLGNGYALQYYVNQSEYNELTLIPANTDEYGIGFGVVRPVSKQLLSILNKVFINLSDHELQNIIYPNTTYDRNFSIGEWIRLNPFISLTFTTLIMSIIILLLVRGLRMRKRMNEKTLLDLQKHRQIYELANDYFFEYNATDDTLMISADGKTRIYDLKDATHYSPNEKRAIDGFVKQIKNVQNETKEVQVLLENGDPYWVSLTGKTITDPKGKNVYIIGKINDINEEKIRESRLVKKAEQDSLTHVYNAETCRLKISQSLASFKEGQIAALMVIDVDTFKTVNDQFGHLQGDKALIYLGEVLLEETKQSGICGRLGGDEFLLYRDHLQNEEELQAVCQRISERINQYNLSEQYHLTVSIGAVVFDAQVDFDSLYEMSDQLLYEVKNSGRNHYLIRWLNHK